jgi:hypothetical protein
MTEQTQPALAGQVDRHVRPAELPLGLRLRDAGNARRDTLLIEAAIALDVKDAVIADLRVALAEAEADARFWKQNSECHEARIDAYAAGPSGVWG